MKISLCYNCSNRKQVDLGTERLFFGCSKVNRTMVESTAVEHVCSAKRQKVLKDEVFESR